MEMWEGHYLKVTMTFIKYKKEDKILTHKIDYIGVKVKQE